MHMERAKIKDIKIINFDYITEEDIKRYNTNWQETPDHP